MATLGLPIGREDAERALRKACEILDRLTKLNREFAAQHDVTLAIRVGVNTGEVMAAPDELIVPDRFMTHLSLVDVDENGNSATWGNHVTDDGYGAA